MESGKWLSPFQIHVDSKKSLGAWCITQKKEIIIKNLKEEYTNYIKKITLMESNETKEVKSLIYAPLLIGEKVVGLLSVQSHREGAYDNYQLEIFKALTFYVAIAVENARLYGEVHQLATKDYLTNLSNRAHFKTLAEDEFNQYKRYGQGFSIIMFDLDYFKQINDHFGHDSGDFVLKEISTFISHRVRVTDLLCRYGGEEFLIMLTHTNLKETLLYAEKLRKDLEGFGIQLEGGQTCFLTASFGVACAQLQDEQLGDIIKRADTALYQAKEKGRNAVSYIS